MSQVHIIDHPMIQHKLTIMRDKDTGSKDFRELLKEISLLMGYEVTRDIPLEDVVIETPICSMHSKRVSGRKLAVVPILRAGLGMVEGLMNLVPVAKIGHIGLYRDEETHCPVVYYCKLPSDIKDRLVIVTDPMLATGGSSCDALAMLKEHGCTNIRLMCRRAGRGRDGAEGASRRGHLCGCRRRSSEQRRLYRARSRRCRRPHLRNKIIGIPAGSLSPAVTSAGGRQNL